MKVATLITLLKALPAEAEIRIGDQIEAGPYSNAEVGGIWLSAPVNGSSERVILCANDDAPWLDEAGSLDRVFIP